jgi:hypothetical protein
MKISAKKLLVPLALVCFVSLGTGRPAMAKNFWKQAHTNLTNAKEKTQDAMHTAGDQAKDNGENGAKDVGSMAKDAGTAAAVVGGATFGDAVGDAAATAAVAP